MMSWSHAPIFFLGLQPKKIFISIIRGTFLAIFFTKPMFDPEDDRFRSWKCQGLESTQKSRLMTWGSEQAPGHRKGSKIIFSLCVGVLALTKIPKKHFWPSRQSIQALKTKLFWIYAKNWLNNMGVRTGLPPQQGVQKWVLTSLGGGGPIQRKTKCTKKWKKMGEMLANDVLIKRPHLFFGSVA